MLLIFSARTSVSVGVSKSFVSKSELCRISSWGCLAVGPTMVIMSLLVISTSAHMMEFFVFSAEILADSCVSEWVPSSQL